MKMFCLECESEGSVYFGLCKKCQENPEIWTEYTEERSEPHISCAALPGTQEKISVMEKRWDSGQTLFSDKDAQLPPDGLKVRVISPGVYSQTMESGDIKYHARVFRAGKSKSLGSFDTAKAAKLAASRQSEREEKDKLIANGIIKASGWGILSFHKKFWKSFTEASERRDEALSKMFKKDDQHD